MTDPEINIAIAEACGWTQCRYIEKLWDVNGVPPENWRGDLISGLDVAWIPNYCHDLNAMHKAEQLLWNKNWSLRHEFVNNLARIMNPIHGYRMQEAIDLLDATARQRAEAFLKTLNLWKET